MTSCAHDAEPVAGRSPAYHAHGEREHAHPRGGEAHHHHDVGEPCALADERAAARKARRAERAAALARLRRYMRHHDYRSEATGKPGEFETIHTLCIDPADADPPYPVLLVADLRLLLERAR